MTPPPDSREAWGAGLRPPEMIRRNGTLHEPRKDDTVFVTWKDMPIRTRGAKT
jgi:hypothetical protein